MALLIILPLGCGKPKEDTSLQPVVKYAFCTSPCGGKTNWTKVKVKDKNGTQAVGRHTSLALDSKNNPAIAYYDTRDKNLKYATCTADCTTSSPTWVITTVDGGGDVGRYTSLKLDSANNPHLSYYDAGKQDLRYAICIASCTTDFPQWKTTTVDGDGDVGWYTSLSLNNKDKPRIAYYDRTNGTVKYAFCGDTADCVSDDWTVTQVDNSVGTIPMTVERAISLSLDKATDNNDRPWIAYTDAVGNLKYAVCRLPCTTELWFTATADDSDSGVNKREYPSLIVDSASLLSISYSAVITEDLKPLKLLSCIERCGENSPVWFGQSVPSPPASEVVSSRFSSLALDTQGALHIAYHNLSSDRLGYASCSDPKKPLCGTPTVTWVSIEVEDGPGNGQFASLAVGSDNIPRIAYSAAE